MTISTDGTQFDNDYDVAHTIRLILDEPDVPSWERLLDIYALLDSYAGDILRHDMENCGSAERLGLI